MTQLSWHQQRAAGFHALPYDVVGYDYNGRQLCAYCLIETLISVGEASPAARDMDTDDVLDQIAQANAIDRDDESSYDSDEFPKVIFRDSVHNGIPHEWYRTRLTGNVVCRNCGLLPLDSDDTESECYADSCDLCGDPLGGRC